MKPWGERMVDRIRARPWGLAVCVLEGDETTFSFDAGDDPVDRASLFQIGSVTKSWAGMLAAPSVRGRV